jgi:hypothetical protein
MILKCKPPREYPVKSKSQSVRVRPGGRTFKVCGKQSKLPCGPSEMYRSVKMQCDCATQFDSPTEVSRRSLLPVEEMQFEDPVNFISPQSCVYSFFFRGGGLSLMAILS